MRFLSHRGELTVAEFVSGKQRFWGSAERAKLVHLEWILIPAPSDLADCQDINSGFQRRCVDRKSVAHEVFSRHNGLDRCLKLDGKAVKWDHVAQARSVFRSSQRRNGQIRLKRTPSLLEASAGEHYSNRLPQFYCAAQLENPSRFAKSPKRRSRSSVKWKSQQFKHFRLNAPATVMAFHMNVMLPVRRLTRLGVCP